MLNDTLDFYRYFDATPHAEFLFVCVRRTIEEDSPYEADFLRRYDKFRNYVSGYIEMPDRMIDLLFRFLDQSDGRLSRRAREREFEALTDDEVGRIEHTYRYVFAPPPNFRSMKDIDTALQDKKTAGGEDQALADVDHCLEGGRQ